MSDTEQMTGAIATSGASPAESLMARLQASPLKLAYAFVSSPYPIRCSPDGGNESVVNLQVLISNRQTRPVKMRKMMITIRTGENTAAAISSAPSLPEPVYDRSPAFPWTITVDVDKITIEAKDEEEPGEVTDTIIFTLPGIVINRMPGTVPIVVSELDGDGQRIDDRVTYDLVKVPNDFPVLDFYAEPAVLTDLDKPVTLYWKCTPRGQDLSYAIISSTGWMPKNCVGRNDCFSFRDGHSGVRTPGIGETTNFFLDVIGTDAEGRRTVIDRLMTTVRVEVPRISPNSTCSPITRNGRIVLLKWLAYNAVRCSIRVDGVTVKENVPFNTYTNGYPLVLDGRPGPHQIVLVAYGASGAMAPHIFPNVEIGDSQKIAVEGIATDLTFAPDGRLYAGVCQKRRLMETMIAGLAQTSEGQGASGLLMAGGAVAANGPVASVEVFNLATKGREKRIPLEIAPSALALTGNGRYMVAAPSGFSLAIISPVVDRFAVIDLAAGTAATRALRENTRILWAASCGSGSLAAIVGAFGDQTFGSLLLVDATGAEVPNPEIRPSDGDAVITTFASADGRTGVTAPGQYQSGRGKCRIASVDIEGRRIAPGVPSKEEIPLMMKITPDGKYALVADEGEMMSIVELATGQVESEGIRIGKLDSLAIVLGGSYGSLMAISPEGHRAYAIRGEGNRLAVIDVHERRMIGTTPIPTSTAVAVGPDGSIVLSSGGEITLL